MSATRQQELDAVVAALLPPTCTGADLVAAIEAMAATTGQSLKKVLSPLTNHPGTWIRQVRAAEHPRPATIERVQALLAGKPVPQLPPGPRGRSMLAFHRSPAPPTNPHPADRPAVLRSEIFAETGADSMRRMAAQSTGTDRRAQAYRLTTRHPLEIERPMLVEVFAVAGADHRRESNGREPCPFCQTRGDIGCKHFAPSTVRNPASC